MMPTRAVNLPGVFINTCSDSDIIWLLKHVNYGLEHLNNLLHMTILKNYFHTSAGTIELHDWEMRLDHFKMTPSASKTSKHHSFSWNVPLDISCRAAVYHHKAGPIGTAHQNTNRHSSEPTSSDP
jgi:hypothetical protein